MKEPLYTKVVRGIRNRLKRWGVKVSTKDDPGGLTISHYGYITSKMAAQYYKEYILPNLLNLSNVWTTELTNRGIRNYNFKTDTLKLLKNHHFQ